MIEQTKAGIVSLVGLPNAGKSTLVNKLVGQKVSIVTPKAQTTRFRLRGVCMAGDTQIVLTDTPGLFFDKEDFSKAMFKEAEAGIADSDAVLIVVDASRPLNDYVTKALKAIFKKSRKQPMALALNKVDKADKAQLLDLAKHFHETYEFEQVFMISALKGDGIEAAKAWMAGHMPAGPYLYDPEELSDLPMRHLAAEVTREHCFKLLKQEMPYEIHVLTEHWEEKSERLTVISQQILVRRDTQKKLVIGKGGEMLKRIGIRARTDLEKMLEKKVHLDLHVKVDPKWQEKMVRLGMHPEQFG